MKKGVRIFAFMFLGLVAYIIICQYTVFSVDALVENAVVTGKEDERLSNAVYKKYFYDNYNGGKKKIISECPLEDAYIHPNYNNTNVYNVDFKCYRKFAIHFGGRGVIFYKYSVNVTQKDGTREMTGIGMSHMTPAIVKIRLIKGKWWITEWQEEHVV